MGTVHAHGQAREATVDITVIRADGTVEHHGTVSYWHRNPLRRLAWRLFGWRGS
jgi:hypothetical protein